VTRRDRVAYSPKAPSSPEACTRSWLAR
jgi:hypothetical protein